MGNTNKQKKFEITTVVEICRTGKLVSLKYVPVNIKYKGVLKKHVPAGIDV
jgi:hypothetical protein